MSKQAKQILDSIKTDPTNWTYTGTRWRRADGVIEVRVHNGWFFPDVTIHTPSSRNGWVQDEIELPVTLMQRYTFGKLDRKSRKLYMRQEKETEVMRTAQEIQRLLDRPPPIEINPPAQPAGQQVVI